MEIDHWGIFEVTREQIVFRKVNGTLLEPGILTKILPFGTFEGESIKQIIINNYIYFTYFTIHADRGNGICIVVDTKKNTLNLLDYLSDLKQVLFADHGTEGPLLLKETHSQSPPETIKIKIKDFDTAVFSFLTKKRVIIVGDEQEITKILSSLLAIVPLAFRNTLEFVTQSASLTENVNIIGMPYTDDILRELTHAKGSYTIIFPQDRTYGPFTSKACKKIAHMIENGDSENVKNELNTLIQLAQDTSDLPLALDFAKQHNLHLSDAQLVLLIRASYFGKAIPTDLLESVI